MKSDAASRFWKKVEKTETCWIWTARKNGGYGHFGLDHKLVRAHRFAWTLEHGDIPEGLSVLHSCDNPSCVRPSHLFLGTQQDNVDDCIKKGRKRVPRGESHHLAKLTAKQVHEIRERVSGGALQQDIAKVYGVTEMCISRIVRRKSWKHI